MDGFRTCGPFGKSLWHIEHMPTTDLPDEEYAAIRRRCAQAVDCDRYSQSPRLRPLKTALAKLDPASASYPRRQRRRHAPVAAGARADDRIH